MRYNRWLIPLVGALVLAIGVTLNRERLERAVIADRIYHGHVFTLPPPSPGESRWQRLRADAQFYWDLSGLRVEREKRLKQLNPDLRPLVKEIKRHQDAYEALHTME